jgi:hypothetical protein
VALDMQHPSMTVDTLRQHPPHLPLEIPKRPAQVSWNCGRPRAVTVTWCVPGSDRGPSRPGGIPPPPCTSRSRC